MLMTAPYECGCRGCRGIIRAGERVSWVDPEGPYHISCSPNSEDVSAVHQEVMKENQSVLKAHANATKNTISTEYAALITATLITEGLIVGAIAFRNPPGYYMLLRLVVCTLAAFFAFRLFAAKRAVLSVFVGFTAVMYNPILQVRLPHDVWQLINSATIPLLAAALYMLRPANLVEALQPAVRLDIETCEHCRRKRVTLRAEFHENISYFYERKYRVIDANLCFPCAAKIYGTFTLRTLLGTWWGLIGMCLGPVIIVSNTLWFIGMSVGFVWRKWRATSK